MQGPAVTEGGKCQNRLAAGCSHRRGHQELLEGCITPKTHIILGQLNSCVGLRASQDSQESPVSGTEDGGTPTPTAGCPSVHSANLVRPSGVHLNARGPAQQRSREWDGCGPWQLGAPQALRGREGPQGPHRPSNLPTAAGRARAQAGAAIPGWWVSTAPLHQRRFPGSPPTPAPTEHPRGQQLPPRSIGRRKGAAPVDPGMGGVRGAPGGLTGLSPWGRTSSTAHQPFNPFMAPSRLAGRGATAPSIWPRPRPRGGAGTPTDTPTLYVHALSTLTTPAQFDHARGVPRRAQAA